MKLKITLFLTFCLIALMSSRVSAQTPLATPVVKSGSNVSTTGITANWTAVASAVSYDITIYDATPSVVTTTNVAGASSATLAITGLSLSKNVIYTYTITAIGDGGITFTNSLESPKSIPFYIQTDNQVVFKYAVADVALLNTDLKGGAADIYELTTSGGAYTFNTGTTGNNNTLIRNTTVRAAAGLAAKPILKLNSTTAGTTCNIFYTITPSLTIRFEGLEFDGVNAGGTGQPLAFYSAIPTTPVGATGATDTKLYVTNCYFHNFLNAPGNGTIRFDPISTSALIDIQGSTFNNCAGRVIYNNEASGTTLINIKNCTFSNLVALSTRCNAVYNTAANGATQTFDHCTFYNIPTSSTTSPIYVKALGGLVTIKNSIFTSVLLTQPLIFNTTILNCYVGGLASAPTGTSNSISGTIATVPAYTNAGTLDFSLTNKTSFLATTDGLVAGNTIYYTALPKLSTPVVGTASSIGTNGFTANWSTVANASGGYSVKVYEGGVTLVNTTPCAGQTSTSVAITGLKTGTFYTFTVTALGDAVSYDNSLESSASTSFSTLGLAIPVVGTASSITSSSFTANWTPVLNASSYNVMTYLTTVLVSTTNILGTASSSVSITGLAMGTTYTYKVVAVGDGVTYTNSDPSASSAVAKTLATTVTSLNPNFADGTWGAVSPSSPALGGYPIFSANGWDLTHAQTKANTSTGPRGEAHSTVLMMDKSSNFGVVLTPVVSSNVAQLEIHSVATAGRQFFIQSTIDGGTTWLPVGPGNTGTLGTYYNNTSGSTEQIDFIPTGGLSNVQFKITDLSTGAFTFYQIITRNTTPAFLPTPTNGDVSAITTTGFTANWTPVPNAAGYDIFLYKGTTLVSVTNAPDQATSSLAITGVPANTGYTYKVLAKGDGDNNYSDSYLSAACATTFNVGILSNLGAYNWSSASAWPGGFFPATTDGVIIADGTTVTVDVPVTTASLTVGLGKIIVVSELTVTGRFTNTNTGTGILVKSDASGTGSFKYGSLSGTGKAIVERYVAVCKNNDALTTNRAYYISAPVTGATAATALLPTNQVYEWDATNEAWLTSVTTLTPGKGYVVGFGADAQTLSFSGSLNSASVSVPLVHGTNGWNLMGNPFPSAIDWNLIAKSFVNDKIWFRTTAASGARTVDYYNHSVFPAVSMSNSGIAVSNIIPSGQAVWVQTNAGSPSLTIPLNACLHSTARNFSKGTANNVLRITIAKDGLKDEALVYFFAEAENGIEATDMQKMLVTEGSVPQIYTLSPDISNKALAMNGLPIFNAAQPVTLQLAFVANAAGKFSFDAYNILDFDASIPVFLKDKLLNTTVDLRTAPVYSFNSEAGTFANRFELSFDVKTTTGIKNLNELQTNVYADQQNIHINFAQALQAQVDIVDIMGRIVKSTKVTNSENLVSTAGLQGIYLVRVKTADALKTVKVWIK